MALKVDRIPHSVQILQPQSRSLNNAAKQGSTLLIECWGGDLPHSRSKEILLPMNWSLQKLLISNARDAVTVPGLTPKTNWGKYVTGAVDLLVWFLNVSRYRDALKALEPDIKKMLPVGGGVLIRVAYCTTAGPTSMEGKRLFQSATAARAGMDAGQTLSSYKELISSTGAVSTSCPESWRSSEEYLWITADSSN